MQKNNIICIGKCKVIYIIAISLYERTDVYFIRSVLHGQHR